MPPPLPPSPPALLRSLLQLLPVAFRGAPLLPVGLRRLLHTAVRGRGCRRRTRRVDRAGRRPIHGASRQRRPS
eukprot:2052116-Prymnesium_polylepis.1